MCDHCLDISGAVLRHELTNRVEVLPELRDGLDDGRRRISGEKHIWFAARDLSIRDDNRLLMEGRT